MSEHVPGADSFWTQMGLMLGGVAAGVVAVWRAVSRRERRSSGQWTVDSGQGGTVAPLGEERRRGARREHDRELGEQVAALTARLDIMEKSITGLFERFEALLRDTAFMQGRLSVEDGRMINPPAARQASERHEIHERDR